MEANNSFYLRQFAHLLEQNLSYEEAFDRIIGSTSANSNNWEAAKQEFLRTNNLSQALKKIYATNGQLLEQLELASHLNIPQEDVIRKSSSIMSHSLQIATIVKSRLIKSFSYAAWVALVALVVLSIFTIYVAPMFYSLLNTSLDGSFTMQERLDALTFKSWHSIYLYLPPIFLIALFIYFSLTPVEKLLGNKTINKLPFARQIQMQLARVYSIQNILNFQSAVPKEGASVDQTFNSDFFNGRLFSFNKLFTLNERNRIISTFELGTAKQELSNLATEVETQAIENINKRTGILATILHLLVIYIVANLVYSMYLPIFKLGSGF